MAGTVWVARHFPVQIGRAPEADFRLEENGVWDRHLKLEFKPGKALHFRRGPGAGRCQWARCQTGLLRNGDVIELGSAKLQFWLADTKQRRLRVSEWATWALITSITLGQVALIYWLVR